jgi:hypothetical protein
MADAELAAAESRPGIGESSQREQGSSEESHTW